MDIVVMIICCLVCLAVNFLLVIAACYIAMKAVSKQLVAVIDECEKEDKDELFMKIWKNHNR